MSQRNYVTFVLILILLAAVIYICLPNTPGIPFINHPITTKEGLDLQGGLEVLLEVDLPATTPVTTQNLNDAIQILTNRSNGLGVSEVTFQTAGNRRILAQFPGLTNTQDVISVLKQTALLEFVDLGDTPLPEGTKITTDYAKGQSSAPSTTPTGAPTATSAAASAQTNPTPSASASPGKTYHTIMTGADLVPSKIAVTTNTVGQYEVAFSLTDNGRKIFSDYTTANVGKYLAIVLDNTVISAPTIKQPITDGSGVIEGNFTQASGNALAVQLRGGSLPIPLRVAESTAVGASLGQDSVRKSEIAGIVGLAVVIIFMGLYYRLPGVLADFALIMYALTTFALYRLIPVTLTLPGIAGFVLSIGVAVDANILIFERLKEELRAGRTLRQAIDLGWKRAWPSIRDSNISTLITCSILFIFGNAFGASMVKGFAVTLALGVLVSLFTAIIVTRTFLHVVLDSLNLPNTPGGLARRSPGMNIIGKRYLYFAISLLVIVPGLLSLLIWGLPLAIDFTGGSILEVQFEAGKAPQPAQVIQVYNQLSIASPEVQSAAGDSIVVRSREISEDLKTKVISELEKVSGSKVTIVRFDTVGPSVAKEVGTQAAVAVAVAALAIIAYISFAFRGVPHAFRFGISAIIAMLHDVAVVIGMEALLGHFIGWEADALFLTALLTVIGFSVHDTIVVFDRIRENSNIYRRLPFEKVVNHSIVQTLDRSINTQLTVMFTLLALALFGGVTIRHFVVILLIGVFSGTYSSIFNASPILVVWENKEWRYWFRGNWKKPSAVTTE